MLSKPAPGLAVAVLVIGSTALLAVQSQERLDLPAFGVETTVVAVPVFVTDKAGHAVAGLVAADFQIEDQGKQTPIVAFLPVDVAQAADPAAPAAGTRLEAAAHRQFMLLFDLVFSTPAGILRARRAAAAFVRESLAPSDLAAVATFGQTGVQVLVSFTPDRSQVERAIAGLGLVETQPRQRDPLSIAYDLGVPRWGPGIGPPPEDSMSQQLIAMARQMARGDQAYYRQRVEGFLAGLVQLTRTLEAAQGRKQLILLSAGFDSSVLGGARGQESNEASEAVVSGRIWEVQSDRYFGDSTVRDAQDALFRAVAVTDTVIHTVDVTGLATGGAVDQQVPQPLGQGRDTLAQLAANTGGRFIADANNLRKGLDDLLEGSRHYYVLAFEPQAPGDRPDRPRKLKVRVRGDGLAVSYRRGYVLAARGSEAGAAAATLQAADAIAKGLTGGPIALHAVAVPYRNARGARSLPVILQADGRALVRGAVSRQLRLEVLGYAFDAQGGLRDVVTLSPVVDLGAVQPALEAKGLQIITSFSVPDGPVELRFVVRDNASQRAGSLRLRVEMPSFEGDALVISPPLVMDDPRTRLVQPAASRGLRPLEIPFRLAEQAFTADPLPTLANGIARDVCVMAWGGPKPDGRGQAFDLEALLRDEAGGSRGELVAGKPRVVPDADGLQRYVFSLTPKDVPPGAYELRILLRDKASGASAGSALAVRVD